MYSAWQFGKKSRMSKFDLTDDYKNIPCKKEDLRLQGFFWLEKFFSARAAVGNFDICGNSLRSLALTKSLIPASLVHRQLDDVPFMAPVKTGWEKEFTESYANIFKRINVVIAEDCPKLEKVFKNETKGNSLTLSLCHGCCQMTKSRGLWLT